ncbi:MAG: hypothetical protein AB8G99_00385, partial [Planctomycetaceae bacterium]
PPQTSPQPNRLLEIKVDLGFLLSDSQIERSRKAFIEIEDWWDFLSFDNRFWWSFRRSRGNQTGANRMALGQFMGRYRQAGSLRKEQVSIANRLTPETDLTAHLTLDVIPDGLQFRMVTSRDAYRFWMARTYAFSGRILN